jgi:2-polyprenyl-3-methyl-5-hydroxy-6-metoxy-1,4-benzoquinol methylase
MDSVQHSQDDEIVRAWHMNAEPWSGAVRSGSIASRIEVTNGAILNAVHRRGARRILDVGCGEGWLAHALSGAGCEVVGIDAVPALVERARRGAGEFHVLDYRNMHRGTPLATGFQAAVCNFSLLGESSVDQLLGALPGYLAPGGALIIQSLHPLSACGDAPYSDGWRAGSWAGCSGQFGAAPPWYFRTLASWLSLLSRAGFALIELKEPTAHGAHAPASVLFSCIMRAP